MVVPEMAEFNESDHPRAANGEFGSGGGSGYGSSSSSGYPWEEAETLESSYRAATAEVKKAGGGSGNMGLTPDHIKNSPEFKAAKAKQEAAGNALKSFNEKHSAAYSKIPKEERIKRINERKRPAQDMALDASARTIDTDGRMHIDRSHISKAAVNPYYGFEIPNAEMLGLDPQKIYYLFRSPEELSKGADTFARLPILSKHIPVSADSPRQDLIVGSIGSEVNFLDPYLDADVCIWDAKAIAGIETETVREFSCAYHYVPLMTPGKYNGERYDGIMTQIRGNHLALVEAGRAGSDVLAADSNPFKRERINQMTKLGKALFVALGTAFPKLAQDSSKILFEGVTKKNFNKAEIRAKLLAFDSAIPPEQLDLVMDAMMDNQEDPEPKEKKAPAEDEETEEEKKKREEKEKEARDKAAKDEAEEGEKKEKKMEAAMDSFRAELREAEEARREVRSVVGDVIAQDSAAEIYGFALDQLKIDRTGVTGVPALKALFKLAASKAAPASRVAQDSAGLVEKFPAAARFRQA
jgi:uncharacterized protein